jgi:hypothetical protein
LVEVSVCAEDCPTVIMRFCPTDGAPLDLVAYTELGEGAGTATGVPDPCRSPLFQGKET